MNYDVIYILKKTFTLNIWILQVQNGNKDFDALLSDICISTSAAPTYLPAYKFTNNGVEFNMIDGGVAANNPVKFHTFYVCTQLIIMIIIIIYENNSLHKSVLINIRLVHRVP